MEKWTKIIRADRKPWEIDFKEIWDYRDLIYLLVRRDFVAKYKQTILGPLWFVIQPLLTTVVFTVIFNRIAKISTNQLPPLVFYFSGLTIWNYFSKSLSNIANTFRSNAGLFGKVYFPRLVIPISVLISNLMQFVLQLVFLVGFMIFYAIKGVHFHLTYQIVFLPLWVIFAASMALGFGLWISALTTRYRDLSYLLGFGMQLWMYATPIAYPLSILHGRLRQIVMLNPMTAVVEGFKLSLLGRGDLSTFSLFYSLIFTFVILVTGILIFNKVEQNFMDVV